MIEKLVYLRAVNLFWKIKKIAENAVSACQPKVIVKGSFPYLGWVNPKKCDMDITIVVDDKFEIQMFADSFFRSLKSELPIDEIVVDRNCFTILNEHLLVEINFARVVNNFGRIDIRHPSILGLACPEPFIEWVTSANEELANFYKTLFCNEYNEIEIPLDNSFSQDVRRFKILSSEISGKNKLQRVFTYIGVVYIRYYYDIKSTLKNDNFSYAMEQLSLDLELHAESKREFILRNPCDPKVVLSNNFSKQLQCAAELSKELREAVRS